MTYDEIRRDNDIAAGDATDIVELNPQVRWTADGKERTFKFIWPEWQALQELARLHGWRATQLSMDQSWSAAEARPFCEALERALAVLPDDDTWQEKCAESFPPKQPMSPFEWWSGIRKRGLATEFLPAWRSGGLQLSAWFREADER